MALALARPCRHGGGCPALVVKPETRCPEHRHEVEHRDAQARGTASQRGYGTPWQVIRRRFLNALTRAGVAQECGARLPGAPVTTHSRCTQEGLVKSATHVDHIVPHGGETDPRYRALLNLQLLCASCHSRKTATEDSRFARREAMA